MNKSLKFMLVFLFFALGIVSALRTQATFETDITQLDGNNSFLNYYYGEMWNYSTGTNNVIDLVTPGVYVNVTGLVNGSLNGMELIDNQHLRATKVGHYLVNFGFSFKGGNNNDYGVGVRHNGVMERNCYTRRTTTGVGWGNTGNSCIVEMQEGDVLTVVVDDEANPVADITLKQVTVTALRVGG